MKQFNKITTCLLCSSLLTSLSWGTSYKYSKYKINSTESDFSFGRRSQPNLPTQRMESTSPQSSKPYPNHKTKKGWKKIKRGTPGRGPCHNPFYDYSNDGAAKGDQTPVIKLGDKYSPPNSQFGSPSKEEKFGNELLQIKQKGEEIYKLPIFRDWIIRANQRLYQSPMGIQLLKECDLSSKTVAESLNNPPKSTQRSEILAWVRKVCEDCGGLWTKVAQSESDASTICWYWIWRSEEWEITKELKTKEDLSYRRHIEIGQTKHKELQQLLQQRSPSTILQEHITELREAIRTTLLKLDATQSQDERATLGNSYRQLFRHFGRITPLIKNYADLLDASQRLFARDGYLMLQERDEAEKFNNENIEE